MDLFELTERIFHGVVYFIYNLIFSIWTVFTHPVRGPTTLQAHYEDNSKRQIGGMTLLFLIQFILLLLILPFLTGSGTLGPLGAWLVSAEFRWGDFWPALLSSLVAAVLVDAGLRLLLRRFYQAPSAERERAIGRIEYAMAATTAVLSLGLWQLLAYGRVPGTIPALLLMALALLAVVAVIVLTAAFVMAEAIESSGQSHRMFRDGRPERPPSRLSLVLVSIFFTGLLGLLSSTFGMAAGAALQAMRDDSTYTANQLRLLHLTCAQDGDSVRLAGAIWNGSGTPAVLRPEDFTVALGATAKDPDEFGRGPVRTSLLTEAPDALPTVATPKAVQSFGPWTSMGPMGPFPPGESCLLIRENLASRQSIAPLRRQAPVEADTGAAEANAN